MPMPQVYSLWIEGVGRIVDTILTCMSPVCMSPVTSDWLGVLHLSQLYCMNEAGRLDRGLVQQSGEYGTYNQAAGAVLGAVQR